ncbi:MAG TPA: PIN domain-containing protein [Armatimonadota bacterium]|jgi:predicted nucleic acid-binding protein
MGHAKQNVTLVVEEELLLAARKVALDQRTSVNQLVREYLAALVEEPSRRRLARARLKTAFETGIVGSVTGSGAVKTFMTGDKDLCFVDTNVLVYGFDKSSSPKKRVAQRLLTELMEEDRLRVSTQVLQELFVTLTKKVSQSCSSEEALAVLEDLTAWPLMVIDYAAVRAAVGLADQARLSFWDALIVVAAARTGAAVLHTEDLNDGQAILGARICNPFAA